MNILICRHDAVPTLGFREPLIRARPTVCDPAEEHRRPNKRRKVEAEPYNDNINQTSSDSEPALQTSAENETNFSSSVTRPINHKCTQTDRRILRNVTTMSSETQTPDAEDKAMIRKKNNCIYSLLQKCRRLRLQCLNKDTQLRRIYKRHRRNVPRDCRKCRTLTALELPVRNIINEQIDARKKKIVRWSESTIKMAKCLFFKSPRCYEKLKCFIKLPSKSTIARRSPNTAKSVSYNFYLQYF